MDLETATELVRKTQNEYLRGTLDPILLERIRATYPQAIPDWNKMKLNLLIKKKKLFKKMKSVMLGGVAKSAGCRRYRPGKQDSTTKKQVKAYYKVVNQYKNQGLNVILPFEDFMDEVCMSISPTLVWNKVAFQ